MSFKETCRSLSIDAMTERVLVPGSQVNRETLRKAVKFNLPVAALLLAKSVLRSNQRRIDPIKRARILATFKQLEAKMEKTDE